MQKCMRILLLAEINSLLIMEYYPGFSINYGPLDRMMLNIA